MAKADCPHCDKNHLALSHPLIQDENFWAVCDVHPLTEGHILIIPKAHITCIGALAAEDFERFVKLYEKVKDFLEANYGSYAVFEHGVVGQTVFHAHVHFLPFNGEVRDVVPEKSALRSISDVAELKDIYKNKGKYLFLQLGEAMWSVDSEIGKPRFFRDRFATALGKPQRGDWKKAESDPKLMEEFEKDVERLEMKWRKNN